MTALLVIAIFPFKSRIPCLVCDFFVVVFAMKKYEVKNFDSKYYKRQPFCVFGAPFCKVLRFAVAAQHVDELVGDHGLDGLPAGLQVLPGIEVID